MDCEGVAVLGRPLVHVDDLHTDAVLLQEQGRDEHSPDRRRRRRKTPQDQG